MTRKVNDAMEVNAPLSVAGKNVLDDLLLFSAQGTLSAGAGQGVFRAPFAIEILGVTAAVQTAPTGASILLDLNKNGTTMFTTQGNRPTIAASATSTSTEAVPDITAVAIGDVLTIDRDQVGSSTPGSNLSIFIRYRRT